VRSPTQFGAGRAGSLRDSLEVDPPISRVEPSPANFHSEITAWRPFYSTEVRVEGHATMSISSAIPPSSSMSPSLNESVNGNAASLSSFDISVFKSYLLSLLPPVLGATLEDLRDSLFDDEFDERISRFAAEGGSVIYVAKTRLESEGMRNYSI
jgi:hypothetical protein